MVTTLQPIDFGEARSLGRFSGSGPYLVDFSGAAPVSHHSEPSKNQSKLLIAGPPLTYRSREKVSGGPAIRGESSVYDRYILIHVCVVIRADYS